MMIAEWNEGQLLTEWRAKEARKRRRFDIAGSCVCVFAICAIIGVMLFLLAGTANADQPVITWQGRTEPAHCYTPSDSDPAITTCISESFLCTLVGGAIDCVVKRS